MRPIDHNYWTGKHEVEADITNPDLRIAMQQLYGKRDGFDCKFDFGRVRYEYECEDRSKRCMPDGYSSYTSLTGNYAKKMPFRPNAIGIREDLAERCRYLAGTIAGEIFFPVHRSDGITINQARGIHPNISDMLYLTLDNIKKYYSGEEGNYPLKDAITRYGSFFKCFASFDEYIEYNFLQDWNVLPKKFPADECELISYWESSIEFMERRAQRIEEYAIENDLFDE